MNKWLVLLLSVSILSAVLLWAMNDSSQSPVEKPQTVDQYNKPLQTQGNVTANDVTVSETDKGFKVWEISAKQAVYNNDMGQATLQQIHGKFLKKDNTIYIEFSAPKGLLKKTDKYLELTNGVQILAQDLNIHVTADKLIWRGSDTKLESVGNVMINYNDKAEIKGTKAKFPPNLSKFEIEGNTRLNLYK